MREKLRVRTEVRTTEFPSATRSAAAQQRLLARCGEPLFIGDWMRVLMIHFACDARLLQPHVPYALDCLDGRTFVTLVAFTLENLRLPYAGKLGALVCRPISNHHFLNVRTYVVNNGEPGIHFLAEWLSNRLAVQLGPRTFGLPYRWGEIAYAHDEAAARFAGIVRDRNTSGAFQYQARAEQHTPCPCPLGSRDEWLMERYTAFNAIGSRRRFFRVWHPPWPQIPVDVTVNDLTLLTQNWPCLAGAELTSANYSPGLPGVWMGRPHGIKHP